MGASGWEYVVPYQRDLGAALDSLRREVFAAGDYVKPSSYGDVFDLPDPSSVDDLTEQDRYWEFMGTSGTHSIIDVLSVMTADFDGDDFGDDPAAVGRGVRRALRRGAAAAATPMRVMPRWRSAVPDTSDNRLASGRQGGGGGHRRSQAADYDLPA